MMENDAGIQRAFERGERNAEVVPLIQNWCAHARIVIDGGVGMLEEMTNLPIGRRRVTCAHEQERGANGTDLAYNAVDFYDHNCASCRHRVPVRIPNLLKLVQERDDYIVRKEEEKCRRAAVEQSLILARKEQRNALRGAATLDQISILARLDEFDQKPSIALRDTLLEAFNATPEAFTETIQEILVEFASDGGDERTDLALTLLTQAGYATYDLVELSLRALARREAVETAGRIIANGIDAAQSHLIPPALEALLYLARPLQDWHFHEERPPFPEPLLAAYRISPEVVEIEIRRALRNPEKEIRRTGAWAARALLTSDRDGFLRLAGDLRAGFSLPDDHYDLGTASGTISDVFAEALRLLPEPIDRVLLDTLRNGSEPERVGAIEAYEAVVARKITRHFPKWYEKPHEWWREEPKELLAPPTPIEELAFARILATFSALPSGETLRACWSVFQASDHLSWDLLGKAVKPLLGTAAIASAELASPPRSSSLEEGAEASALRAMEVASRGICLKGAVQTALETVIRVAAKHPDAGQRARTTDLVIRLLQQLPPGTDAFRARIVKEIGELCADRAAVPHVLPAVYRALTDTSSLVRAAAAAAYVRIARAVGADAVPTLMHESFLALLGDRKAVVLHAVLDAISEVTLPEKYVERVVHATGKWADIYGHGEGPLPSDDGLILKAALEAYLSHRHRPLDPEVSSTILCYVERLNVYDALKLTQWHRAEFCKSSNFPRFLTGLFFAPAEYLFDGLIEELLDEIEGLAPDQVRSMAARIVEISTVVRHYGRYHTVRCIQLLVNAGAWSAARSAAEKLVGAHEQANDPPAERDRARAILAAIDIEIAAAAGSPANLASLMTEAAQELFSEHLPSMVPRVAALECIRRQTTDTAEYQLLDAVVGGLRGVATEFQGVFAGEAYQSFAELLSAAAQLLQWVVAVRSAEVDADRHQRAVRLRVRELLRRIPEDAKELRTAAELIAATRDPEDIERIWSTLSFVALPIPLIRPRHSGRPEYLSDSPSPSTKEQVVVVSLSFSLNGQPLTESASIMPGVIHDLGITARLSRWPEGTARIEFEPLHVEPSSAVEAPRFVVEKPGDGAGLVLRAQGRLLVRVPHDLFARPFELSYSGQLVSEQRDSSARQTTLVIHGQQHLQLECFDSRQNPFTGVEAVDERLRELRSEARRHRVSDEELSYFFTLLGAVGSIAYQSVADKSFPGRFSESDFQDRLRELLRLHPRIGAELEEHPEAAGGITDLSFKRIRLELKVDDSTGLSPQSAAAKYGAQLARYVVGSGRRCGVLAVLDNSPDTGTINGRRQQHRPARS